MSQVQTTRPPRTTLGTVLVAVGPNDVDRIERLAEEAAEVAAPAGATVVIGHVFTHEEYEQTRDNLSFDRDAEVTPDIVAKRHSAVRDLVDRLEEAGVDYRIRGVLGDGGKAIVDLAEEEGVDRVLVGGRKRSPTGKAVFGSVAQEVMLSAPCPVTFVRADTK